jgi:hypothetical protein
MHAMRREGAMPLKDSAQFCGEEITAEPAVAQPGIADLTNAEITELLPRVTDEATRDALVKVLWTRAAQQARAEHPHPETPRRLGRP